MPFAPPLPWNCLEQSIRPKPDAPGHKRLSGNSAAKIISDSRKSVWRLTVEPAPVLELFINHLPRPAIAPARLLQDEPAPAQKALAELGMRVCNEGVGCLPFPREVCDHLATAEAGERLDAVAERGLQLAGIIMTELESYQCADVADNRGTH